MRYQIIVLSIFVVSTFAKNLLVPSEVKIDFNANWRVIGGENAPDGEYPYLVSIRGNNPHGHNCGGSIVHEEWIITAAHCVNRGSARDYKVVAGSNKLSEGGDFYDVLEVHWHKLFNYETLLYDVAIIKVNKIKFSDKVSIIKLEKSFVGGDVSVTLSGWGATVPGGSMPNDLQHLTYNTTTVEECRKRVPERPIENTQICTLHRAGMGGCHGDSGSGLIRSVDGIRYVVGIVSGGPECGSGYFPDIFSRVSSFISWFNKKCNCNL